jgi:hypothetical protein
MGLIENLERIKELVESGAGGGGEDWRNKWFYYPERPYGFIDVPELSTTNEEILIVFDVYEEDDNDFYFRTYLSKNSTVDVYIDDVFEETISVSASGGAIYITTPKKISYEKAKHQVKEGVRQVLIKLVYSHATDVTTNYVTRISLEDYYNKSMCHIREIYANGNYVTLRDTSGENTGLLYRFYTPNVNKYYTNSYYNITSENGFLRIDTPLMVTSGYERLNNVSELNNILPISSTTIFDYCYKLQRITFKADKATGGVNLTSRNYIHTVLFNGSFGGDSTSSSLTFSISANSRKFTRESYLKMANSISPNTNGNTRTFSLYANLYNQLTEEDIAILTNKGYTVASA